MDKNCPSDIRSSGTLSFGTSVLLSDAKFPTSQTQASWTVDFNWTDNQQVAITLTVPSEATGFTARSNQVMVVERTVRRNGDGKLAVHRTTAVAGSCHPYHSVENTIAREKAYGDTAAKVIGSQTSSRASSVWSNYCLEWTTVSGPTHAFVKTKLSNVTASTNCTTALADESWGNALNFFNTGGKSKFVTAFSSVADRITNPFPGIIVITGPSVPYACHQVQLRDGSGNAVAQTPAIHLRFGQGTATDHGGGYITAINGTSGNYVAGTSSRVRTALPATAQVTLSTSPATVPEGSP